QAPVQPPVALGSGDLFAACGSGRLVVTRCSLLWMDAVTGGGLAEAQALRHLSARLQTRFGLPAEEVDAEIASALAEFTGRPVRDFIPILVEREVVDGLGHHHQGEGDRLTT